MKLNYFWGTVTRREELSTNEPLRRLRCTLSALFVSSLVISVVFAIIPLCHHVLMLAVAMALSGMAMGVIDTIANQQLVKLYQKDSAVSLQVLHFFIGLGALVSPLVVDPFLSEGSCVLEGNMTANSSTDLHHLRSSLAGFGGLLGCCNYGDMKDRPASYFLLYILGGAVLFITNGIIVGVIVVQCLLLILYSSHVLIFMGTCVLGLFISSVFPCMVALTEDMVNYKGCYYSPGDQCWYRRDGSAASHRTGASKEIAMTEKPSSE